jgi:hypothetical protein
MMDVSCPIGMQRNSPSCRSRASLRAKSMRLGLRTADTWSAFAGTPLRRDRPRVRKTRQRSSTLARRSAFAAMPLRRDSFRARKLARYRSALWPAKLKLARGSGERKLEAAGVEPASENTPSQASTCVAALENSRPPSKSDGNRRSLAPNGSRRHPSEPPVTTSLHL